MAIPLRIGKKLAPAHLPDQVHPVAHLLPVQVQSIPLAVERGGRPPEKLAKQNMRQCFLYRSRGGFQQICDTHMEAPLRQADDAVRIGKPAEIHIDPGNWNARMALLENPRVNLCWSLEQECAGRAGSKKVV